MSITAVWWLCIFIIDSRFLYFCFCSVSLNLENFVVVNHTDGFPFQVLSLWSAAAHCTRALDLAWLSQNWNELLLDRWLLLSHCCWLLSQYYVRDKASNEWVSERISISRWLNWLYSTLKLASLHLVMEM